jgi:hypothetical protein
MKWQLVAAHVMVYWRRQGWAFGAGLSMLVIAVVVYLAMLIPAQEEVHALQAKNDSMARNAARAPATKTTQNANLEKLLTTLPANDVMLEQVGSLVQLAAVAHVTLDKGEYRITREASDGLQRQQLSFPVKVRYLDLRDFLGRALPSVPGLALTSLSLQRGSTQTDEVDGRVVFTLYARSP